MRPCTWVLAAAVALAGCNLQKPTTPSKPRPTTSVAPTAVKSATPAASTAPVAAALAGKVALLFDGKAQGEPLISNNGGSIIANNGGSVVSDNGGSIVANNGGSAVARQRHALAAATLTEFGLVDAVITLEDAAGKPVLDAQGKPLTAKTDAHGGYSFTGALPEVALVVRVKLWQGGELLAVLPRGARGQQAINTATTLGARYVLDQYVKGSQQTLERLPAAEAQTLYADAANAAALLDAAPSYKAADTVALAESLRAKAPALDKTLSAIKALLLGQVGLGNGQDATSVPLNNPGNLMLDAAGNLLFTEDTFGRVRRISPAGKLSTFADVIQGQVKRNFPYAKGTVRAADGTIYFADGKAVTRLAPDGKVTNVLGQAASNQAATELYAPFSVAVAGDTLYVGEDGDKARNTVARLLKLPVAGGTPQVVPVDPAWNSSSCLIGVAATPAGDVYVAVSDGANVLPCKLYHVAPDGGVNVVATDLKLANYGNALVLAPDGTLYLSETFGGRVLAIKPDGSKTVVLGPGAPGDLASFSSPGAVLVGPDGTLYVSRVDSNTIWALSPAGQLKQLAGRSTVAVTDPATLSLAVPRTAAFAADGALLVTEAGQERVLRFDGKAVSTVAGGRGGITGDGGPATAAGLSEPWGLAVAGQEFYIGLNGSVQIRKVDATGTISSVVSGVGSDILPGLPAGQTAPALKFHVHERTLAVSPSGQLYFASTDNNQIYRLRADGQVEPIAGKFSPPVPGQSALASVLHIGPQQEASQPALEASLGVPGALAFDAKGDLYVAETGSLLVRKITGLDTATPTIGRAAGSSSLDALATDPGAGAGLSLPIGLAVAPDGTLYVSEIGTDGMSYLITVTDDSLATATASFAHTQGRVRKITPDGKVTIIAGPGGKFFADPLAPDGLLFPESLALSADGRLAIVDAAANLVHILPAGSF